ncbi:MAG: hypothetical protein II723_05125, partial [Oscillospiraceae bacterium]|nr:hypothetical protein [Oscillospiraceae bacterium]
SLIFPLPFSVEFVSADTANIIPLPTILVKRFAPIRFAFFDLIFAKSEKSTLFLRNRLTKEEPLL